MNPQRCREITARYAERTGFDVTFKDTQAIGFDLVHTKDVLDRVFVRPEHLTD